MSKRIFDRHIELVERVNNAKTKAEERDAANVLYGFREALEVAGINQLMACDAHYFNQGIYRPMCAGVFLDVESRV